MTESSDLNTPASPAAICRLRHLLDTCSADKTSRAVIMISACIDEGIRSGKAIIATLAGLGFNPRHIGLLLHRDTGPHPDRHLWYRDEQEAYCNHPLG